MRMHTCGNSTLTVCYLSNKLDPQRSKETNKISHLWYGMHFVPHRPARVKILLQPGYETKTGDIVVWTENENTQPVVCFKKFRTQSAKPKSCAHWERKCSCNDGRVWWSGRQMKERMRRLHPMAQGHTKKWKILRFIKWASGHQFVKWAF